MNSKHIVAVMFYLQEYEADSNKKTTDKNIAKASQRKRKTTAERIEEILGRISRQELKDFVRKEVADSREFKNSLVNYFERNDATVSKQLFAKQIKSTLKLLTAGHDFIPRSSADKLSNFIDRLLETAQNNKKQQNYLHAAYICTAIMEQLIAPLEQGLDSSGYVLDSFSAAYDVLYQIVQQQMPEEARKYLIDDCLKACDQKIYDGWEWHYGILEMTALLSETEEDAKRIFERIDKGQNKAGKLHLVKYKILLKVYPTVYGIITIGSRTEVRCLGGNLQHFLQVALFFHQLYSFS